MKVFYVLAVAIIVVSCNDSNEDIVNKVDKNGSIETQIKTEHLADTADVLVTTHTVYKNGEVFKTIRYTDTLPTLGNEMVTDENDNERSVKKDYEVYITVK
jgi:(p)ppGpp synthase/HD superfamily hydrolase